MFTEKSTKEYCPEAALLGVKRFETEGHLQAFCVSWHNRHFRKESVLFSVPNGGTRVNAEVLAMISEGLLAGASDLIFCFAGKVVFIEMKNSPIRHEKETGSYIKPKQELFKTKVEALGLEYYCCKTFFEFALLICQLLQKEVSKFAYI